MALQVANQSFKRFLIHRPTGFVMTATKNFSKTSMCADGAYGSDGKTFVSVLNSEEGAPLMINGYSIYGFRLNNGLFAVGPVAIFPRSILSWNVEGDNEINAKSLSLFLNMSPRLDILIIGMSDSREKQFIQKTRENIYRLLKGEKNDKMQIEVLPTEKAVTVFNFLNAEQRFVGGAFIPPIYYTPNLDDEYRVEYLTAKKEKGDFLLGAS